MNTLVRKAWVLILPVALAAGCTGGSSAGDGGDAEIADGGASDAGAPDAAAADAGPPVREVVKDAALFGATSVDNLLVDPLFKATFSSSYSFMPLASSSAGIDYAWAVPWEAANPARAAGARVLVPDASSKLVVMSMFNGGKGPFRADVWATTVTDDDMAIDDGSGVQVQVGEAWVFDGNGRQVHELDFVPGDSAVVNGVLWHHYAGSIDKDLPTTCTFVLSTLDTGRDLLVAGPQVVPEALRPLAPPRPGAALPQARASRWDPSLAPAFALLRGATPALDSPRKVRPRLWKPAELRRLP